MAYKDKDKQRDAQREWVRQKRASEQGSTEGSTKRGRDIKCFEDLHPEIQATIKGISTDKDGILDEAEFRRRTVIAIHYQHMFPDRYEPKTAQLPSTYQMTVSERAIYRPASELGPNEHNPVSKPGDADYDGCFWEHASREDN